MNLVTLGFEARTVHGGTCSVLQQASVLALADAERRTFMSLGIVLQKGGAKVRDISQMFLLQQPSWYSRSKTQWIINLHEVSAAHGLGHSTITQAEKQQSDAKSLAETSLCTRLKAHKR